jgi:quercetin dioxygenase-like cupin family protein
MIKVSDALSGQDKVEVNKGDTIHYRADVEHKIINIGKSSADFFLIVYFKK